MASSSRSRKRPRKANPPWEKLPPDITAAILRKLGTAEILTTAVNVCTTWRRVCQDPSMWWYIKLENSGGMLSFQLVKICRRAVDLSRGELIGITITGFGNDDLLRYISQRSNQLEHLVLVNCYGMTSKGVIKAIEKLPLLETLCLQYISINVEDVEIIGRSCPLLNSFKLTNCNWRHGDPDAEALAIATNMPRIRRLYLTENRMTNLGFKAILKGCRNLETLDLRRCDNFINLDGNLGKYCSKRIKDIKLLVDSDDDYRRRRSMIDDDDDYIVYESLHQDIDVYDNDCFDD